jgi:hypothetical protein
MKPIKLAICLIALGSISSAAAQGTSQSGAGGSRQAKSPNGIRYPSSTQPTNNNPFQNPIGQGVAPATNANAARNGSQISAPTR